jgi:hypothetical protein
MDDNDLSLRNTTMGHPDPPDRDSDELMAGLVGMIGQALSSDLDPLILAGLLLEGAVQAIAMVAQDEAQAAARQAFIHLALARFRATLMH